MWPRVVRITLIGYLIFGRGFAYLGIVPLRVFIGEVVLGAFLLTHARLLVSRVIGALLRPTPISGLAWGLFVVLAHGVLSLLLGIGLGYPKVTALQCFAFSYYPLYLLAGIRIAQVEPDTLERVTYWFLRIAGVYGTAYVLFLQRLSVPNPFDPTKDLLGGPVYPGAAILAALVYEPSPTAAWPYFAMCLFLMLAKQVRSEWVGFIFGIVTWAVLSHALRRVALITLATAVVVGGMAIFDVELPGVKSRGGNISVREIVGRAVAAVSPEAALELTPNAKDYAGTVSWRTRWWSSILEATHAEPVTTLLGQGYGFPLVSVVPALSQETDIRTPHSAFFYALGYSGWLGVAVFVGFQLVLVRYLWLAYRLTGSAFGLSYWAYSISAAQFSNALETPFGAVPFYILVGMAMAPVLGRKDGAHAYPPRP